MTNDKQRKRLVELLKNANKEAWNLINMSCCEEKLKLLEKIDELRADYLLANGVIVPPVKASDKVFYIHEVCDENGNEYLDISAGEVVSVSIQAEGLWAYCRYFDGLTFWHKLYDELGKELFTSREEAEAKLKEGVQE